MRQKNSGTIVLIIVSTQMLFHANNHLLNLPGMDRLAVFALLAINAVIPQHSYCW